MRSLVYLSLIASLVVGCKSQEDAPLSASVVGESVVVAPEPIIWPSAHVRGVAGSGANGAALIDDVMVAMGESYKEMTVVEVLPSAVLLEYKGHQRRIGVDGETSGTSSAPPAAGRPAAVRPTASPALQEIFGPALVRADGSAARVADLQARKIGIYFSAEWCPPCRDFTPRLVAAYEGLKREGKPFEVVFVSSDRSQADMFKYMRNYRMPWFAVPFDGTLKNSLNRRYGVRGIPMLVIIDANGKTLATDGRGSVMQFGAAAYDRW